MTIDETGRVAVIGTGPVGLATALALADRGMPVLLIESGTEAASAESQALSDATMLDERHHAQMALAVRRGFGGTSKLWGGRCLPFDAVDFMERPWLGDTDWPIGEAEIAPWYEAACRFLDCGPATFEEAWPGPVPTEGLRLDRIERWCAQPDMARVHGDRVRRHPMIRTVLGATVLDIDIDPVGSMVGGLEVARDGTRERVMARAVVVACGGLETARLLLASRRNHPGLFGGEDGALGRYYMGHLFGTIADITLRRPGDDARFVFRRDASGRYVRRRLTLDAETQCRERLGNLALSPELPELHDPSHGSAILSLAYLALAMPVLGPRLMAEAIRRRKLGAGPVRVAPHLRNLVAGAPSALVFALGFLKRRYLDDVRLPGFFVLNRARRYACHFHAEQRPDRDSRVTLGEARDALGQPRLVIDQRFARADAESIVHAHDVLAGHLAAAGLADITHRYPPEARANAVLDQASDGFHQIGTARMGREPRLSVVDRDCRVHGVKNLYLAGSAVFPSSGQANPTLLAVALAFRLASHLAGAVDAMPEARAG